MSGVWRQVRRFMLAKVLHVDDTPHRIALGVAVGILIGFTPTVGLQMVLAVAVAALLGANRVVCIPMVWITNPITLGPIYLACWRIGATVLGSDRPGSASAAVEQVEGMYEAAGLSRLVQADFWRHLVGQFLDVGTDLWVGCIVVGMAGGLIGYVAAYRIVVVARERRRLRRVAITLRRGQRRSRSTARAHKVREA